MKRCEKGFEYQHDRRTARHQTIRAVGLLPIIIPLLTLVLLLLLRTPRRSTGGTRDDIVARIGISYTLIVGTPPRFLWLQKIIGRRAGSGIEGSRGVIGRLRGLCVRSGRLVLVVRTPADLFFFGLCGCALQNLLASPLIRFHGFSQEVVPRPKELVFDLLRYQFLHSPSQFLIFL